MSAATATYDRSAMTDTLRHILSSEFFLFCHYYDPGFFSEDKPYLLTICRALQRVSIKEIRLLMISVPPRAGKSYTLSLWCAWMIGRGANDPDTSIMRNSYGQTLAEKFSYDIREIVQSERFLDVFPAVRLKRDHSRVEDWAIDTATQSSYFCSGVGGAITGKGCRTAAILDDPIKNLEDALSETMLEKTWLWYLSTHRSRMESGCPEIHIATRWSQKDPIGRLLETPDGASYEKIVIPALIDGRSFCEQVKTTDEYLEMRRIVDEFIWEAEFMQNPVEAKGLLFPVSGLKRFAIGELRKDDVTAVVGFTDTADEGSDYLASLSVAIVGKKAYLVDVVFTQDPVEVTEALVARQLIDNDHKRHIVESNNGGKAFARNVQSLIRGKSRCTLSWQATTKNKETRILMTSGQIKEFVHFRSDYAPGSMYDKFMRQLTSYTKMGTGQKDDAPDALTGLCEYVWQPSGVRFFSTEVRK